MKNGSVQAKMEKVLNHRLGNTVHDKQDEGIRSWEHL